MPTDLSASRVDLWGLGSERAPLMATLDLTRTELGKGGRPTAVRKTEKPPIATPIATAEARAILHRPRAASTASVARLRGRAS